MSLLLEVRGLVVGYRTRQGWLRAVDEVSFSMEDGETLGLVGESGCGKTTLGHALLGLLPENGRILGGSVRFRGQELTGLDEAGYRAIRWKGISIVFQGAMNSLNPVFRVGDLLLEALRAHESVSDAEARNRVVTMLEAVGIARGSMWAFPHELSGGMRQRAVIAMSLICHPALVIADEPTTAFDVILQDQILGLIRELRRELGIALLVISHDIAVVAEMCQRVAVMYAGRIVEEGSAREVFHGAGHPYTVALLKSYPDVRKPRQLPVGIPGSPPWLVDPPKGCRFEPRCQAAMPVCRETEPVAVALGSGHHACCFALEREVGSRPHDG